MSAAKCLGVFIETELLPYCRRLKKSLIKFRILGCNSRKVLDKLEKRLPPDVVVVHTSESSLVLKIVRRGGNGGQVEVAPEKQTRGA